MKPLFKFFNTVIYDTKMDVLKLQIIPDFTTYLSVYQTRCEELYKANGLLDFYLVYEYRFENIEKITRQLKDIGA